MLLLLGQIIHIFIGEKKPWIDSKAGKGIMILIIWDKDWQQAFSKTAEQNSIRKPNKLADS